MSMPNFAFGIGQFLVKNQGKKMTDFPVLEFLLFVIILYF